MILDEILVQVIEEGSQHKHFPAAVFPLGAPVPMM
jgi:hypothetical protein